MSYEFYLKEITDVDETNKIPIAYCDEFNVLFEFLNNEFINHKIRLCNDDINNIIIEINNEIKLEYELLKFCENKTDIIERISEFNHCISQLDFIKHIINVLHKKDKYVLMIKQICIND